MTQPTAQEIIDALGLLPHPEEGGFFSETHRLGKRMPQPTFRTDMTVTAVIQRPSTTC